MITGMNATDIAEYFALVRELEPDTPLSHGFNQWYAAETQTPRIVEVADPAECNRLADLCDQLPKVPTLDEHCARQRTEFTNMGKGLLWAVYASICTMGLLYIALKMWEAKR